ncbi:MAG: bifunctional oligoribonuclease/PAP phosphatase NrnA [Lachnospiraceae bacterium]|nr:bifunctional oligoribonuclease/PAP phosphatase NrnA [Lachnospiraceae bacterium]
MAFEKEKFWEDVKAAETIGIAGHIRPDGDCVGSTLGLYCYIRDNFGKEPEVFLEEVPKAFEFIEGADRVVTGYPNREPMDLFIALDCGDEGRLGKAMEYAKSAKKAYCIDHHATSSGFMENNLVIPDSAATAQILYTLFEDDKIGKGAAEALYLGIVHDTGVFKHSCTTRETMEIAGALLDHGVSSSRIIDGTFYEKTYLQNQILGRCLMESILCLDGKVIFSSIDRKIINLYGLGPADTEGIIDQLRVTKGVEVAILIRELTPRSWRVSMRSCEIVDVSKICAMFGGGGHVRAAGATMSGSRRDVINNLTTEIEKQLEAWKKDRAED